MIITMGMWVFTGSNSYAMNGPYGSTVNMPNTPAIMSGCGSIYQFAPTVEFGTFSNDDVTPTGKNKDRVRVPTAPMLVPAYGYMSEDGIPTHRNFYATDDEDLPTLPETLRSMRDGRVVLWYQPDTVRAGGLENIQAWMEDNPNVVAIPWLPSTLGIMENLQGHSMPMGRSYAFSTWNVTHSCDVFNVEAADGYMDFVENLNGKNRPAGEPAPAVLDEKGQLPDIPFQGSDIT